jgi:L,D-peptidoglycan transpeptidase YkuD (ErfK/YbiS/YcfS/YnhG family)
VLCWKKSLNYNKNEGDYSTPKGIFNLRKLYFRKDRVGIPNCKINKKDIKKDMAWCDDPKHKKYNEEIQNTIKILKKIYIEKIISMII